MQYMVCIDDTDMPGTKGTGWLVEHLCHKMKKKGAKSSAISRHQLYVHKDIPFTSHNSAMCFEMETDRDRIDGLIAYMAAYLKDNCEKGSDPGLCVASMDQRLDSTSLMAFGKNAKKAVSSKKAAYDMAGRTGIHLSEHGGTGQGVVGAVAGVGLRLSGNDGRYRGWYHLGLPGDIASVEELCGHDFIDELVTVSGQVLPMNTRVHIGSEKTKTVRMGGRQVLVVMDNKEYDSGLAYRTITKKEAKHY